MGNKDDFRTVALARRLIRSGLLVAKTKEEKGTPITRQGKKLNRADDDDDSAEDEY